MYIDHVLTRIAEDEHSCKLCVKRKNFQGYAEDLVSFAPSTAGLKALLERLEKQVINHELIINIAKMRVLIFKPIS